MVDDQFDNDDNPYVKFRFRMTTWIDGEFKKTYLPVIKCKSVSVPAF